MAEIQLNPEQEEPEVEIVYKMIRRNLDNGLIQPLPSTVYHMHELENAFRYMSTGKHVGKVLIQIRENETSAQGRNTSRIRT